MNKVKGISIVLFGVLAFGFLVSCARTPEQKRDRHLAAGEKLLIRKDYGRAMLEFRNAVQAMPQDAESYYQLGLAFLGAQRFHEAIENFQFALSLNAKHLGAQMELARLMASTSDPELLENAETRLMSLLQSSPGDTEALNTLALTELKLRKTDAAIHYLEQTANASPASLYTALLLAQTKLARQDYKGAEEALKNACQKNPGSTDALVILGYFYFSLNKAAEAEQQFTKALQINPASAPALLELGKLQSSLGRKQEAEQTFRRLSSLPEKGNKEVLAVYLFQEGRKNEAIREFERLVKADPADVSLRTHLVAAYQGAGRLDDAQRVLSAALKKNAKDLDARLQRAELLMAAGKYDQAEVDLNAVLHLKPDSAELHYILAKLHHARGSILVERQELAETVRLNPNLLQPRIDLAQLLLRTNAAKSALGVLSEAPPSQQNTLAVIIQRNWGLWATGEMAEMRKGIDQGLAQSRVPDLLIQDGLYKLRQGNPTGARASLNEALQLDPRDLRALDAIRQSYFAQKQAGLAVQTVQEFAARFPQSAAAQEFLGKTLAMNGQMAAARTAFMAAKAADPADVAADTAADMALVQLDAAEGKWADAEAKLKATVVAQPKNVLPKVWLGHIEAIRGEQADAVKTYQEVLGIDPNRAAALNDLAYLLADSGSRSDEALKYAERALEISPEDPDYSDTLGWVLYNRGIYARAVGYIENAANRGPNPIWKYHLAMAYAKAGNLSKARAIYNIALKTAPNVPEAKDAGRVLNLKP